MFRSLFWLVLGLFVISSPAWAELTLLSDDTIEYSEDDYSRRIYSYDFAIDATGKIHILYGRPEPSGAERVQIIYATKQIGGTWDASSKVILEEYGDTGSISNNIILGTDGTVHVSYLVKRDFTIPVTVDFPHATGLVYQTISNGVASEKSNISAGSYHTKMRLDTDGQMIFVREYEIDNKTSTRNPRALAFYKQQDGQWTGTETKVFSDLLTASGLQEYRLADFIIDPNTGRYHLSYGDKNADELRAQYPTANPGQAAVHFPAGAGHNLIYVYSDDKGESWKPSIFDNTGSLSENEFWTDMLIDENGNPVIGMYRYATDASGIHNGTSNRIGRYDLSPGAWDTHTVAGKSSSTTSHRAGSALGLAIDDAGGLHGIWDNSPDQPIDAHASQVQYGGTMYRYSYDGKNWDARQPIFNFSVEGKVRTKIFNNRLFVMFLGDHRKVRLLLAGFQLPSPTSNLFEAYTDKSIYSNGENIDFYARLQGDTYGDYYLIADGPYDCDVSLPPEQGCMPVSLTYKTYYLDTNQQWQTATSKATVQPTLTVEGAAQPQAQACSSNTQCNFSLPMNKTGFYIAEVRLPEGNSDGVWGLSVATTTNEGGYSTGGLLYSDYVGFTTFTLKQADSMTVTAFEYINNGTVNIEIADANGNIIYGPIETTSGTQLTSPELPAGFYVSRVSSATTGVFGISLNGQNFATDMNAGGWIDSATKGFIAFAVSQAQTISLSSLFGQSYGDFGASKIEVDIYYPEADGSRSLYWSSDATKFASISTTTVATGREQFKDMLFYNRPFDRVRAMQAAPFINPSSYLITTVRTVPNGGSISAEKVSPEYSYILHINP
ncbi:hypothetical protein [Candidatus Albibeggiatoa sp. nov. BB20]|uniref:hypothetical protein n=1 Tax=Candidatus Albibeggiatoa sp. nov. BB20 TaxID=3162723 RepID=UPI0033655287